MRITVFLVAAISFNFACFVGQRGKSTAARREASKPDQKLGRFAKGCRKQVRTAILDCLKYTLRLRCTCWKSCSLNKKKLKWYITILIFIGLNVDCSTLGWVCLDLKNLMRPNPWGFFIVSYFIYSFAFRENIALNTLSDSWKPRRKPSDSLVWPVLVHIFCSLLLLYQLMRKIKLNNTKEKSSSKSAGVDN